MGQIISLLKVQLGAAIVGMLSIGNNRRKKPHALYAGLTLFVLGLGFVAYFYCYMIGTGLKQFQSIEILPMLVMSVTSLMVFFTTVFKIKGTVFGFRDYDMVMSLPVSAGKIVASRLLLLYAINMIFVVIIMVPMLLAYGSLTDPDILFYLIGLILMLTLPLIPIILASVLGTLIAYLASRFRYSNILSIILSLGLLLVFVVMSAFTGNSSQELVNISKILSDQIIQIYPLADLFRKAIIEYDMPSLLLFIAISLISFIIYALIVGKVFKKINTMIMSRRGSVAYRMGELRQSSPLSALLRKELRRYFSSTVYVLNTSFGIVLLTVGAIALFFVDPQQLIPDQNFSQVVGGYGPVFAVFCISTTCTTAASISLEGKNLWIMKSIPVTAKTIFQSKLALNLLIVSPAFLATLLMGIALDMGVIQTLLSVLIAVLVALFVAIYGLIINLRFPNFNWITEVVVVKQSAATMIAIFTGMFLAGLVALMIALIADAILAYLIIIGILLMIDMLLYRVLMKWGSNQLKGLY